MNEQRKINVLIVDDDPVAAEAARSGIALFVDEKRIMTASNSVEMMRILTTTPIDLAFLDMEMPDTDGFTVAEDGTVSSDELGTGTVSYRSDLKLTTIRFEKTNFLCELSR